jgi:hypothetical protein
MNEKIKLYLRDISMVLIVVLIGIFVLHEIGGVDKGKPPSPTETKVKQETKKLDSLNIKVGPAISAKEKQAKTEIKYATKILYQNEKDKHDVLSASDSALQFIADTLFTRKQP